MSPATSDLTEQIAKEMGFPGVITAVNPLRPDDHIVNRQLGQYPPTCPVCERYTITVFLYPTNSNPNGDLLFECLNAIPGIGAGHYDAIYRRTTNTWEPVPWSQKKKEWEPPTLVKIDGGKPKKIKGGKGKPDKAVLQLTIVDKSKAKVAPPAKQKKAPKAKATVTPIVKPRKGVKVEDVIPTARKTKIKLGIDPTAFAENDQPVTPPAKPKR